MRLFTVTFAQQLDLIDFNSPWFSTIVTFLKITLESIISLLVASSEVVSILEGVQSKHSNKVASSPLCLAKLVASLPLA